jgi:hypothetical protein
VEALVAVLGVGVRRPRAKPVAVGWGLWLGSIFRIFYDVETLNAAGAARQLSRIRHLFVDVMPTGTLPERVAQVVDINARLYESVAPIRRAALRAAPESPALQEQLARARGWVRSEVERVFAPELVTAHRDVTTAVELVLSFEAWDQLRSGQGVSLARATATVVRTVTALLTNPE